MDLCVLGNCEIKATTVLLLIAGALFWLTAYVNAIRVGLRDRTYGVPVVALALNFAWETIYSVQRLSISITSVYHWTFPAWAVMNSGIVYTYFAFGRTEFPACVSRPIFIVGSTLVFVISYTLQAAFLIEFGIVHAPAYTAFLQNVLMSGLFIAMLISRRGTRGQSLTIAVCKCIGTILPTIAHPVPITLVLGTICFVLDVIYIGLIMWANKHGGCLPPSFREHFDENVEYQLIESGGDSEMRSQPADH
jgi:hypothetical protein